MSQDIHLLHHGLDAIVQRDLAGMPAQISPADRMKRYLNATRAHPDRLMGEMRAEIGGHLQEAWRRRRVPQWAFLGEAMESIRRKVES